MWASKAFYPEQMSKYRVVSCDGTHINEAASLKAAYPQIVTLRYFSPMAYQGEVWSMPFLGTGSATDGTNVYAGHWLYLVGTTITSSLGAGDTTVNVADASSFFVGQYVVMYDAPAGNFQNPEHAYVAAVSQINKTITISQRGLHSTAQTHATGSIIAAHEFDDNENLLGQWSYNQSSLCPKDANGLTLGEVMADWLRDNLNRNSAGNIVNAYDGVVFDTDGWKCASRDDVDNNLVADGGFAGETNTWNVGLESFYARLRGYYPNKILSGGSPNSLGFKTLNGTQMEGLPTTKHLAYPPDYSIEDELMQKYSRHMHHQVTGPVFCEAKSKTPILLYDPKIATDNKPFRFSFAITLMEDGYYANGGFEHWFDEYAVEVNPNSVNFGRAIASYSLNETNVRAHLGWLGKPSGPKYRLYDSKIFAASNSLIGNGGLETNIDGWSTDQHHAVNSVNLSQDNTTSAEGTASLHASKMNNYSQSWGGAKIYAPAVTLLANTQYTICFSAKSSEFRQLSLRMENMEQQFYIDTTWARYVACFTTTSLGSFNPTFLVGEQNTEVWIDAVYVFIANADIFRRDFDKGIIIANATPFPKIISLGASYRRIKGTGQDPINNGKTISTVTIAPYDAAILLKKPGVQYFNQPIASVFVSDETIQKSNAFISAFPNPAANILQINFSGFTGKLEMEVADMSGRIIMRKNIFANYGTNKEQVNVTPFSPGMYILIIKSPDKTLTTKFIKE